METLRKTMKVIICDGLNPEGLEILRKTPGVEVDDRTSINREELETVIGSYQGMIVRSRTKVDARLLELGTELRVVGRAGTGVDNIDVKAATGHGILVMNTPGANALAAAEHAVAMMLALARHIPQATASMRAGKWEKKKFMGTEVSGQTIGIIGLGNVGKLVAERAIGLRMNVVAFDPYLSPEAARKLNVSLADLDTIFRSANFITLHSPLTEDTRNLINRESIARMKKGVRIINCARGGIVNEEDLNEALQSGHVAGAALDVFSNEPPLSDNPLLAQPNVILTPHLGASSEQSQVKVAETIATQIGGYLAAGSIVNAVNLPASALKDMDKLAPYLDLVQSMGRFLSQVHVETVERVDIEYSGKLADLEVSLLTNGVLKGLLDPVVSEAVNIINAPLEAQKRGIKVFENKSAEAEGFAELVKMTVSSRTDEFSLAGTVFTDHGPRIVRINEFVTETVPSGNILLTHNYDRPGVIGNIGLTLGKYEINIAKMHLARNKAGDRAMALIKVDAPVSNQVLEELRALPHMIEVRQVTL